MVFGFSNTGQWLVIEGLITFFCPVYTIFIMFTAVFEIIYAEIISVVWLFKDATFNFSNLCLCYRMLDA